MLRATRRQRTIARPAEVRGVGFFHGADVTLRFHPAEPDAGIVFERVDLPGRPTIPARLDSVVPSQRRTTIRRGDAGVEMIEHVMAALAGLQVDNAVVEIDAGECPGLRRLESRLRRGARRRRDRRAGPDAPGAGRRGAPEHPRRGRRAGDPPARPRRRADALVSPRLRPGRADPAPELLRGPVGASSFREELAASRTFLLEAEAAALRAAGIGVRTTEADVLLFGRDGVIGNELRYPGRVRAAQGPGHGRRPGAAGRRPARVRRRLSLGPPDQRGPGAPAARGRRREAGRRRGAAAAPRGRHDRHRRAS